MSFATGEDVMQHVEDLIKTLWKRHLDAELPELFPRITYQKAMSDYGTDKPDLRLQYQISRVDFLLPVDLVSKISPLSKPIVDITIVRTGELHSDPQKTRSFVHHFLAQETFYNANPDGGPGVFVFDSSKPLQGLQAFGFEAAEEIERLLSPSQGDLLILQARKNEQSFSGNSTTLGRLAVALNRAAVEQELITPPSGFQPLWVVDFPLFSPISEAPNEPGQSGTAGLQSTHHPFTSPKSAEDVDLLLINPEATTADHYDLVINGTELGGGSRRIHMEDMQRLIMESVLRMPQARIEEFEPLLRVLRAGCPPHAGIALGFDRLIAIMLGKESVRDVIAFPKGGKGEDMHTGAPSKVQADELAVYGLEIRASE